MKVTGVLVVLVGLVPSTVSAAPLFGERGGDFGKGRYAFEVDATYIHPIRFSDDRFYGAGVIGHWYFGDAVSVGLGAEGYYVDQVRDDTVLGDVIVHGRWHFLTAERYSLFVDGGVGISYAEADVPEGGLRYNYTPRIGGGATVELRENLHLLGGVRFFHISNANLEGRDNNPSQDGAMYYVGVLWTF